MKAPDPLEVKVRVSDARPLLGYRKMAVTLAAIGACVLVQGRWGDVSSATACLTAVASIAGAFCAANLFEHRSKAS